uniref:Uncharacterized protein n=1 Tax=Anguilla anguilla TaxID=7936 RepID=A0A0E9QR59_ANGAN
MVCDRNRAFIICSFYYLFYIHLILPPFVSLTHH